MLINGEADSTSDEAADEAYNTQLLADEVRIRLMDEAEQRRVAKQLQLAAEEAKLLSPPPSERSNEI